MPKFKAHLTNVNGPVGARMLSNQWFWDVGTLRLALKMLVAGEAKSCSVRWYTIPDHQPERNHEKYGSTDHLTFRDDWHTYTEEDLFERMAEGLETEKRYCEHCHRDLREIVEEHEQVWSEGKGEAVFQCPDRIKHECPNAQEIWYELEYNARKRNGTEAECDDPACPGWFPNCETGRVERCDTCQRFEWDEDAAEYVRTMDLETIR